MATIRIILDADISMLDASKILECSSLPDTEYENILRDLVAAGFDINEHDGLLLTREFAKGNAARVSALFKLGAQACNKEGSYSGVNGHVYFSGRQYSPELGALLLKHTLESKYQDIIKGVLSGNGSGDRINIFNNVVSDTDRAELYIRVNKLPTVRPNAEIIELCAKAGLVYPPPVVQPKTQADEIADLKADLAKEREKYVALQTEKDTLLADYNVKLEKATGIIAKLASI